MEIAGQPCEAGTVLQIGLTRPFGLNNSSIFTFTSQEEEKGAAPA